MGVWAYAHFHIYMCIYCACASVRCRFNRRLIMSNAGDSFSGEEELKGAQMIERDEGVKGRNRVKCALGSIFCIDPCR